MQVSSGARKYANPTYLRKLVEAAVEETGLPIALHLDHGDSFELCKDCIDNGFTSVMIDASHHSFEENIAITRKVCAACVRVVCGVRRVGAQKKQAKKDPVDGGAYIFVLWTCVRSS